MAVKYLLNESSNIIHAKERGSYTLCAATASKYKPFRSIEEIMEETEGKATLCRICKKKLAVLAAEKVEKQRLIEERKEAEKRQKEAEKESWAKKEREVEKIFEEKRTHLDPICIMKIDVDESLKCADGVTRWRFYEITDQGELIQYLANSEDKREEYIVEKRVSLTSGLKKPFEFSIRKAKGVSMATYTPQVDVGAHAAIGAALGGTAGAIIGAATAAQANANAESIRVPVSYDTGLHLLFFNGERVGKIELYPNIGRPNIFYRTTEKLKYETKEQFGNGRKGFPFSNEWIEEKFGKARGFYGDYSIHYYYESTQRETLENHIVFYHKFISYYCAHKSEICALDSYNSSERISPKITAVRLQDKTTIGIFQNNMEQQTRKALWLAERLEPIDKEMQDEIDKISQEYETNKIALAKEAEEQQTKKDQLSASLSSLNALQFVKRKKLQEEIKTVENQLTAAREKEKETRATFNREKTESTNNANAKRKTLNHKARELYPLAQIGVEVKDKCMYRAISTCLKMCSEEERTGAALFVYYVLLTIIEKGIASTEEVFQIVSQAYNEKKLSVPIGKEQLEVLLYEMSKKDDGFLTAFDEREYISDYLWSKSYPKQ